LPTVNIRNVGIERIRVMDFDLLIKGGKVVSKDGTLEMRDIGVIGGRIASLLPPGLDASAAETCDVTGLHVFPGVIDVHLHLGHGADISRPRVAKDAEIETSAAASGGVTCMIPYILTSEQFEEGLFDEIRSVTQAGSLIDFGYHFIISTEEQLASVPRYVEEYGVPSFKIFMNNRGGEGARLGLPDIDDGFLYRLAEAAKAAGGMVCPHPENIEVAWVLRDRLMKEDPEGKGGLAIWNASRPAFIEADAVQRAALISQAVGGRLYVVHTSSKAALDAGVRMREAGADVILETCPHYLTHDISFAGGDIGKINPPLREIEDREALWEALRNGEIDTVATDHVHRSIESKQGGIWKAGPGCPGMETLLPVMLSEGYHKRGIPLTRIAQLLCANPARVMGLTKKGSISEGMDADFAIVDLEANWLVSNDEVRSSAGYSIYDGQNLRGKVLQTIVRGRTVFSDGVAIKEATGHGVFQYRRLT
jgi:dihydropyrimidinase